MVVMLRIEASKFAVYSLLVRIKKGFNNKLTGLEKG
jgi:hypothetical protein